MRPRGAWGRAQCGPHPTAALLSSCNQERGLSSPTCCVSRGQGAWETQLAAWLWRFSCRWL